MKEINEGVGPTFVDWLGPKEKYVMRNYEDDQKQSVLFEGEQAERLKAIRISMDQESAKICSTLHQAIDAAKQSFATLEARYEPQIRAVLNNSEYAGLNLEDVGFDFSYMEKHGFILAKKTSNPIKAFLDTLWNTVEAGPVPFEDRLYVEPIKDGDTISKRWDSKVTEPA